MWSLISLSVLLLISAVQPAPRSPEVVEVKGYGRYQPSATVRKAWPLSPQEDVFEEELVTQFPEEEEEDYADDTVEGISFIPVLGEDDPRSSDYDDGEESLRDLEHRLVDSINRAKQELLLIHILLGQSQNLFNHQRPYFLPGNEHVPENGFGGDDHAVGGPVGEDDDDDMFGFPAFGYDQPTYFFPDFPRFPVWHDFPSVDDLPDNYDNSTYEVHVVNGTRIEVNKTINKESGDDFNSFFHHEVIHIRPDQDTKGQVPTEQEPDTTTPQWDEEFGGDATEVPAEDEELPSFPEVENEVASSDVTSSNLSQSDIVPTGEDLKDGSVLRVLREAEGPSPNLLDADNHHNVLPIPKTAAYISKHVNDDAEEVQVDEDEHPPPDLSRDTLVNHVTSNNQGMVQVDPDAEVFDLYLVLEEARPKDDDK